jgi:rfaE bifunctional protein kinase chain/domain
MPNQRIDKTIADIKRNRKAKKMSFVHGKFDVLHTGHIRLLNFAKQYGEYLVVGIHATARTIADGTCAQRLEWLCGLKAVDAVIFLTDDVLTYIEDLRPDFVVKGAEHAEALNLEATVLVRYGGKLLFSSDSTLLSLPSLYLSTTERATQERLNLNLPKDYLKRHSITAKELKQVVERFKELRVLVVGDLILDEYIDCEPLGMSREDPTLVVTPLNSSLFVGGAGIVACHAQGLGAKASLVTIVGVDNSAKMAQERLDASGVKSTLIEDNSRPTTVKKRYRAYGKTLLRVSELKGHEIDSVLSDELVLATQKLLTDTNLVIFSDFSYGCLPQKVIDTIANECSRKGIVMVADSQSSSQIGDIGKFKNMLMITPTEHEARLAVNRKQTGLADLAGQLVKKLDCRNVLITLGAEGLLVEQSIASLSSQGSHTDQLPALNNHPVDVSGAGDCLLVTAAMALVAGGSIWTAAYLGSIAAACQVARKGNLPLQIEDLTSQLDQLAI